ncbi:DUF6972 family protein [Scytonema hofmannii]|uniref:DUF6972 family protein n=1 Tax=Scytonema hofmannii TaxID=34078 RepID=UPI003AF3224D
MQRLLEKEGSAHVFNDEATMFMITQAIIERGEFTNLRVANSKVVRPHLKVKQLTRRRKYQT